MTATTAPASLREDVALREALTRAEGRIAELMRQVFVPGMLRCAKCGFVLISANLNAQDGTVTARETTEHCPNDGAPLWRVSEREAGNDMADRAEEQMRRAQVAEAALAAAPDRIAEMERALTMARQAVANRVESYRPWVEKIAGRVNPWQATLDAVDAARSAHHPEEMHDER